MKQNITFYNRTFMNEAGASPGWLFYGKTNRTANGIAVVKVFCMPLAKVAGNKPTPCYSEVILKNIRLLLGIERIVEE